MLYVPIEETLFMPLQKLQGHDLYTQGDCRLVVSGHHRPSIVKSIFTDCCKISPFSPSIL